MVPCVVPSTSFRSVLVKLSIRLFSSPNEIILVGL